VKAEYVAVAVCSADGEDSVWGEGASVSEAARSAVREVLATYDDEYVSEFGRVYVYYRPDDTYLPHVPLRSMR
jgi:hypothetical protein